MGPDPGPLAGHSKLSLLRAGLLATEGGGRTEGRPPAAGGLVSCFALALRSAGARPLDAKRGWQEDEPGGGAWRSAAWPSCCLSARQAAAPAWLLGRARRTQSKHCRGSMTPSAGAGRTTAPRTPLPAAGRLPFPTTTRTRRGVAWRGVARQGPRQVLPLSPVRYAVDVLRRLAGREIDGPRNLRLALLEEGFQARSWVRCVGGRIYSSSRITCHLKMNALSP
eukprot:scaffold996_cov409-Prasinococcus_capsulatus_cf.AAC.2